MLIAACIAAIVVGAELAERHTPLRHLGTALLVILFGALLANVGAIPAGSPADAPVAIYEGVFTYLAPLSIFWLMLGVDLRKVASAGASMLGAFGLGVVGTAAGALVGLWLIASLFGAPITAGDGNLSPQFAALGGMFVGTYTGGSVNFNAVALHYDVMRNGSVYAGAVAVDNILTAVWMVACLSLPRLLRPLWPKGPVSDAARDLPETSRAGASSGDDDAVRADDETFGPFDLALCLGLGLVALAGSNAGATWVHASLGVDVPALLILTAVGLALAQLPRVQRLRGAKALAMFSVYAFLTVIGAFCDVWAMVEIGRLAAAIATVALCTVGVHFVLTFGVGRVFGIDLATASVASQANVGGGATALAVARSLRRDELVLPAIVVGALGNALGTFLGFAIAGWLGAG